AIPARLPLLTTQLWQFFGTPVQVEVAAAYAMPLLLLTVGLIWLQRRLLARKGYAAVGGKGGARSPVELGPWRWAALAYAGAVLLFAVGLPLAVLAQAAFAKAWGRGVSLDNFTLDNLRFILFRHNTAPQAIVHSLLYAAGAAALASTVALCAAYVVQRRLIPLARGLAFLCLAPIVIPGVVMAIGFFAAYTAPPLPLYGTASILIFAFAARFLPIAYTNGNAALLSVHPELEEAVRILGGGRLTALRAVLAPLLKRSLLGGGVLVFILATHELSAAIFLYTANTRVMSVLLFDLSEEGNFERLASLGLILLALTLVLVALGYKLAGRDFLARRDSATRGG
ncbi:MAG: ABC transporter permease, partial [SAR324 cluster bacterium]